MDAFKACFDPSGIEHSLKDLSARQQQLQVTLKGQTDELHLLHRLSDTRTRLAMKQGELEQVAADIETGCVEVRRTFCEAVGRDEAGLLAVAPSPQTLYEKIDVAYG